MAARMCEQGCGHPATVYAIDPAPGGWGGWYCDPCASDLGFRITDRAKPQFKPGDRVVDTEGWFGYITAVRPDGLVAVKWENGGPLRVDPSELMPAPA